MCDLCFVISVFHIADWSPSVTPPTTVAVQLCCVQAQMEEAFAWAYQRIELHGLAGRKYVAKGRLIAAMIAYGN